MGPLQGNKAIAMLDAAAKGKYGIPAIVVYNLEATIATVRAAEHKRSPAMLLLFPWALDYAATTLLAACAHAARTAAVPITVHMDHAQDPAMIRHAADTGMFDSIMVDMSHQADESNLQRTGELTRYCHDRGVAVEAEPGRIEGGEDGISDTADLEGLLTTSAQARDFAATGIDWLAPAFGNVHGSYGPRGIRLEYDRLAAIHKAVGAEVRLVLHGTDGWDEPIFRRCIEHGATKVNINQAVNKRYMEVQQQHQGTRGITRLMEEGTSAMQQVVEELMDWLGSSGKA
ncbi:fructose-bisphosphate aldolase [Lasallia pustulata]|uniref:Fructose-bisphosphate aldolase n=1 Tax=Lasallia pustulata TaxID=136370 RepID=A0A1W5D350_9LECA|nr:fructose-bisphosphate aldolase [Lasallia pustulata]